MDSQKPKLYSAPKRFDLATMLVVTTAYGILFAGMKALNFGTQAFALFAGFLTFVGVAQALFSSWESPRIVSMLAGVAFCCLIVVWNQLLHGLWEGLLVPQLVGSVFNGVMAGYFCGAIVGSVFLIADYLRRFVRMPPCREKPTAISDEAHSPFDD